MNRFEPEAFETELASLKPVRLPEDVSANLARALARAQPKSEKETRAQAVRLLGLLQWAIPALAVLVIVAFAGWRAATRKPATHALKTTPVAILKPDAVVLSQELVANFEAVTRLPDGLPVRVRCEEWIDEIQLRDPAKGVWLEHRKPRLEVYPVAYEVY